MFGRFLRRNGTALPKDVTGDQQSFFRIVNTPNQAQPAHRSGLDLDLEARIANYALVARMQLAALDVADLSKATAATKALCGLNDPAARRDGACCLMARRLAERGVRFVTAVNGGRDHHTNIPGDLPKVCNATDRGAAGLIQDSHSRGPMDSTLAVWDGEFGRLPTIETVVAKPLCDRNSHGFLLWMAGAGMKRGFDFDATDELGYVELDEYKNTDSDVHPNLLRLLGLDFRTLTFEHEGRDESVIGVTHARVVKELVS